MKTIIYAFIIMAVFNGLVVAQSPVCKFGEEIVLDQVTPVKKIKGKLIQWFQINTNDDTWKLKDDELICTGHPIGIIRSEKEYENFIMHIEWKHMEAGGISGTFVWSKAIPGENRLPDGVEVQMLELGWVNQNIRDGEKPPIAYVHGELFGVGGVEVVPDNPRGNAIKFPKPPFGMVS